MIPYGNKLKSKYETTKHSPKAEIFEGAKGFKTFYEFLLNELKEGDTVYVMSAPREANEKFGAYLLDWNKRRVKKKAKLKILYNNDNRDFGKLRRKMKYSSVRYMEKGTETPAWVDVFGDYVCTINVHGTPVCFLIKNKESAESYKKYFDLLWKQAKP